MTTLAALLLATTLQATPTTPTELVRAMYAEFPWGDSSIVSAPRTTLARYLDAELIALLDADAACSERTGEICNLDGDPIYNAQEAEISALHVKAADQPHTVHVSFMNFDRAVQLTYKLVQTSAGPRIHDIEYGENQSLRGWLSTPIP